MAVKKNIVWFEEVGKEDVGLVGGKEANLEKQIKELLSVINYDNSHELQQGSKQIKDLILKSKMSEKLAREILKFYHELSAKEEQYLKKELSSSRKAVHSLKSAYKLPLVAVRSSATAEDLPDASFAGQQETFLNIHGIENILHAIREVFASLYNDRAISYRVHSGYDKMAVALSAGVQRMVRSDLGVSGVMFTLDTESGFRDVVFITSAYGLGEMVVQGAVNPDEFYVHKPQLAAGFPAVIRRSLGSKAQRMVFNKDRSAGRSVRIEEVAGAERGRFSLSDAEVLELARHGMAIEKHYGCPMDIEWGRDGVDGKIYVVQARPETVKSRSEANGNSNEKF